jgi:uncharacterized protein
MNLEQLKESDMICLETICGSNCYGLNIATSDVDMTGIFLYEKKDMLKFDELPTQVSDQKSDVKFYSLKEFFKLALKGSPNMIELLFIDERFHKKSNKLAKKLIANRDMFISQKCYYSFVNYAFAQIKKAKGQNKWINNPKPKEKPNPVDYMYWIPKGGFDYFRYGNDEDSFACRPIKMENSKGYKLSRVEHGFGVYRMYEIDETFDFLKSGKIECHSISKEEERKDFVGLLNFNEVNYDQDCKDWKNYWGWMKDRNEHRWTKQESGELDYDVKNMMHCIRLLYSAHSILTTGKPNVYVNDVQREHLLKIRNGDFSHEEILKEAEELVVKIDKAKKDLEDSETPLVRKEVNRSKLLELYNELLEEFC